MCWDNVTHPSRCVTFVTQHGFEIKSGMELVDAEGLRHNQIPSAFIRIGAGQKALPKDA